MPSRTRRRPYSSQRTAAAQSPPITGTAESNAAAADVGVVAVKRAHCDREPRTLVRSRPGNVVRRRVVAYRQCYYRVISVRANICELLFYFPVLTIMTIITIVCEPGIVAIFRSAIFVRSPLE